MKEPAGWEEALRFLRRFEPWIRKLGRAVPLSDPDDVRQEAILAALEAARDWDPARGSLSTLAWIRVRQRIQRLGARDRPVPISGRLRRQIGRGRKPPPEALWPLSVEEFGERLAAPDGNPAVLVEEQELQGLLQAAMETLDEEERRLLELLYGFQGTPQSLARAARAMGISRYQARQIQRRALKKLRIWLEGGKNEGERD